ncbi:hypothetical protein J0H58_31895 [bacterium]|nr:hypothetical protein [bacterium]
MPIEVVAYTDPNYPHCQRLKEYLGSRNIPFGDRNVTADPRASLAIRYPASVRHPNGTYKAASCGGAGGSADGASGAMMGIAPSPARSPPRCGTTPAPSTSRPPSCGGSSSRTAGCRSPTSSPTRFSPRRWPPSAGGWTGCSPHW